MLLVSLWLAGCATTQPAPEVPDKTIPTVQRQSLSFPPRQVMDSGDYAGFLAENRQMLTRCSVGPDCEVALFNLAFVHAYAKSPYYNPGKALQYFDELSKKYPSTPGAAAGQAWSTLLRDNLTLEDKRRRLQTELRAKEATLRTLQEQLSRSRALDLQLEKKERELLR